MLFEMMYIFVRVCPMIFFFLFLIVVFLLLVFGQVFLVTGLNRKFGISDEWFAIGDSLILTVLGQVMYMFLFVPFYFSAHLVKTIFCVNSCCDSPKGCM